MAAIVKKIIPPVKYNTFCVFQCLPSGTIIKGYNFCAALP